MRYAFAVAVLIVATVVLVTSVSAADKKTTSGIYLTADDFTNGKLTAEGWRSDPSHKLQIHDVLDKPYIHVTHGSETKKYDKSEVYGFRDSNGLDYRFVGNKEYKILEAKELYIYSVDKLVPGGKGRKTEPAYYFSVGATGEVLPLTAANLKNAFPNNHKFHDSLDTLFKLNDYDSFHKMFKVNRLLAASSER